MSIVRTTIRSVRLSTPFLLIALVLLAALAAYGLTLSYHKETSIEFADLDLRVTVVSHNGDRYLKVETVSGDELELPLMDGWGPSLRTNIYRANNETVGVLDFADSYEIAVEPLRADQRRPSDSWQYLGTVVETTLRPASESPECMDLLSDDPPPPERSWIYKQRC